MSRKKNAGFSYTDGRKVSRTPGGAFNVKAPLSSTIPANGTVTVRTGVKCSNPVLLYAPASFKERGLEVGGLGVVEEGTEIVVTLKNNGKTPALIDGDTVVRAVVLDNGDLE